MAGLRARIRIGVSSAALCVTLVPTGAWAQSAVEQDAVQDENIADPIVVTGSRIRRPNYELPNPVATFDSEQINASGRTNLTDFLSETPALVSSVGSSTFAGGEGERTPELVGLNLLNLRNLGTERTLVLINGRRHVAALPTSAAVDINTIPTSLVERVDVLTGGASAVYGADGVSGVVNFVLKRNFEGLDARAQAGISGHGDAGRRFLSVTSGSNFGSGRGNAVLAYEYSKEDRLFSQDRARYRPGRYRLFRKNPADVGDDPSIPDYLPQSTSYIDTSGAGGVDVDFDFVPDYQGDGSPWVNGTFVPDFFAIGGSGTSEALYLGDLTPGVRKHSLNGLFHFDFSPAASLFAEAKFVRVDTKSVNNPNFDIGLFVSADNPFIPDSIRAGIVPGLGEEIDGSDGVVLLRDYFDLGRKSTETRRDTYRGVIGLEGDLPSNLHYEMSFTHGETHVRQTDTNTRFMDRFQAAVDAVLDPASGQPTCRSNLDPTGLPNQPFLDTFTPVSFTPGAGSGCVPLNVFGEGSPSQAARDWVMFDAVEHSQIKQDVLSGALTGDTGSFLKLPGGAIDFAVGLEWRRESSQYRPDQWQAAGATDRLLSASKGDFNVKEIFAEANAPLLKDLPFAHRLSIGGAVRFSDYSTVGHTSAWKVDGLYEMVSGLGLRGTYAQAVRAPNLGELFAAPGEFFTTIFDPCSADVQNTETRRANCAALLTPLGVSDPGSFVDPNTGPVSGITSGNAELAEERAKTKTLGLVLKPKILPGFYASIDWYDIRLKGAINRVSPNQLAELCVDQPTIENVFCNAIERETGGARAGRIVGFIVRPENVAQFRTSGVDLSMNYRLQMERYGRLDLNLVAGHLGRLEFTGIPGAEVTNSKGTQSAPEWVVDFDAHYTRKAFAFNYRLGYFSKTLRFSRTTTEGQPDFTEDRYFRLKERWQHDVQLSLDVSRQINLYLGINNLTDQKPDLEVPNFPVSSVGRFFYGGLRIDFDSLL